MNAPTKETIPSSDLAAVADKIKAEYKTLVEATRSIVPRAIRFGELLNDEKAKTRHNDWLDYLKDKCDLQKRTAQRYMDLAKPENKQRLEAAMRAMEPKDVASLSLNKAMAIAKGSTGGGTEDRTAVQKYDKCEETLIKKLKDVSAEDGVEAAEEAMDQTIKQLKDTVATMKKGAVKLAA
jgi:hypothetical protein